MLTNEQKLRYFQMHRNSNYRASLRLEGFKVVPDKEINLDTLTRQQILQRIERITARYAG